jgi:hypothetical protein
MNADGHMWKRAGIWQSTKMVKGHRRKWSTKTGDKATAERRAKDHWQQVVANAHAMVDRQASRSTAPKIGELLEVYRAWDVAKPSKQTRRQNANMLERVIALGVGRYAPDLALSVLDTELVQRFQAARMKGIEDLEARERRKFSSNSMLTQARSVFRSVRPYEAAGYKLPELAEFLAAERFQGAAWTGQCALDCGGADVVRRAAEL